MKPLPSLLALVLLSLILVDPAAAMSVVDPTGIPGLETHTVEGVYLDFNPYESSESCVVLVNFIMPENSELELQLYDYGQVIPGTINNTFTSELVVKHLTTHCTLGTDAYTRSGMVSPLQATDTIQLRIWTESNDTVGSQTYAGLSDFFGGPAVAPLNATIYRIVVSASDPITMEIQTVPVSVYYDNVVALAAGEQNFIGILTGIFEGVYLVVSLGWYIFKTIFIENLLLFAALYESVGLCYAANKSRNIFQFFRKIAEYNVAAIKAMYWLIEKMVTILTRIVDALNPLG